MGNHFPFSEPFLRFQQVSILCRDKENNNNKKKDLSEFLRKQPQGAPSARSSQQLAGLWKSSATQHTQPAHPELLVPQAPGKALLSWVTTRLVPLCLSRWSSHFVSTCWRSPELTSHSPGNCRNRWAALPARFLSPGTIKSFT